ncbi:rhomboid family intramembrane serine protease [bacterium]|nr:rhomboid family intramembrane serine protease [bacterium]
MIPIGTGKRIKVLPAITIALIAANTLIWIITNSVLKNQVNSITMIRQRMWDIEKQYMPLSPFSSYRFLTLEQLRERDQEILQGDIIPPGTYDFQVWEQLRDQFEDEWGNLIFQKIGFIPAHFNLIKMITSIFVHGNLLHLAGNMLFLWLSGCNLEGDLGRRRFILLYLGSGVFGSLAHYVFNYSSEVPTVGASGAIAGLMGAFLVRYYLTKIKFFYFIWLLRPIWGTFRVPAYICLPLWIMDQFINAKFNPYTGTAHWAHIGGFAAGMAAIFMLQKMNVLTEQDPEGDEDDDFHETTVKAVKKIKDKDAVIQSASESNLPELLAIVRTEPHNAEAHIALARLQYRLGAPHDSAISYGSALSSLLPTGKSEDIRALFEEMKKKDLIQYLSGSNMVRLVPLLEKMGFFEDAVRIAILFVTKHREDAERPRMLYKIYQLCKHRIKDETRARKAALILKRDYPHLVKPSSN